MKKGEQNMNNKSYDDIINLPHPTSSKHPRMPMIDRAAQFSPFAALTGHDEAVKETARLTDGKVELDEYEIERLNEKLQLIQENLDRNLEATITFFEPDSKKSDGADISITGVVKRIDDFEHADKTSIPIEQIIDVECDLFQRVEF